MEFIKVQLQRIQQQLGGLTASQRMLAATLVIIMVMTLFYWTKYAGTAEMEPVLDTAFKADDITRITQQLQLRGIQYKVNGDRILVPADRRSEALADLAYSQILPQNTSSAFDEMLSKSTPWDPQSKTRELMNQAKQMTLAQIIRNFPGVSNATVIIDTSHEPRIGGGGTQPSATVNITMRSGMHPDKKLPDAAGDLVTGAVANLVKERVHVIVDGVPHRLANGDDALANGGNWLDTVKASEMHFTENLYKHFNFIEGVVISVAVNPNIKSKTEEINRVDKVDVKPRSEKTKTREQTMSSAPPQEAGVVPNSTASVNAPAGAGGERNSTKEEDNTTENEQFPSKTVINVRDRGGDVEVKSASISVPRSYFVKIFKKRNGDSAKEPDDVALDPLIKVEMATIKTQAANCLGLGSEEKISVAPYTDLMPIAASNIAPPAAASSFTSLVSGHYKEIGVGVLALLSLFMMSMMVKKSSAPLTTAAPPAAAAKPTIQLGGAEEAVGEAVEGASTLDGMELDEDAVRAQQMVEQVSDMVKDNPDAAANLIKRWMNRA